MHTFLHSNTQCNIRNDLAGFFIQHQNSYYIGLNAETAIKIVFDIIRFCYSASISSLQKLTMNQKKRLAIFDRLAVAIPEPTTELQYTTPFELLIAVVLSAQATDKGVNKATAKLFAVANTPRDILSLGEAGLKEYIKTIGLFNSKAAHIIKLCQQLLDKHEGEVPKTREELEALAGVGRKTANVILNTAFGLHTIAVDTHIFRVSNRTGIAPGKNVLDR